MSPHIEDREAAEVGLLFERTGEAQRAIALRNANVHPREIARALQYGTDLVPLLPFDEEILSTVRFELESGQFSAALARELRDRRYDRALRKGAPLKTAQVEKAVLGARRKLVAFRIETYARYMAMCRMHYYIHDSWQQQIDAGVVPESEVRRYWVASNDSCTRCAEIPRMNPNGVAWRGAFQTPLDGPVETAPLCPRCRCTIWIRRERPGVRPAPAPGATRFTFDNASQNG